MPQVYLYVICVGICVFVSWLSQGLWSEYAKFLRFFIYTNRHSLGTGATNHSIFMNMFSLFFQVGPALKVMMQEGRRITADDFKELPPEQYEALHNQGKTNNGRVLALYHKFEDGTTDTGRPIMICEEEELSVFDDAWKYIEHMSEMSSRQHTTEVEKLLCVARTLPDVFIKGGPFEYVLAESK